MDGCAEAKAALRRTVRAARRRLDAVTRAAETAAACDALVRLLLRHPPAAVASYAALADELDVDAFHHACWAAGVPVLLPRIAGPGRLTWHRLRDAAAAAHLIPGAFAIREPDPGVFTEEMLAPGMPVVVPGVAFSAAGARLGQGGGFYDRLPRLAGAWLVGVGFPCQLVAEVPCEPHDRRLDALVIGGRLVLAPPHAVS